MNKKIEEFAELIARGMLSKGKMDGFNENELSELGQFIFKNLIKNDNDKKELIKNIEEKKKNYPLPIYKG